jgi:hypothetical protein
MPALWTSVISYGSRDTKEDLHKKGEDLGYPSHSSFAVASMIGFNIPYNISSMGK